jgi:hypothetical protein
MSVTAAQAHHVISRITPLYYEATPKPCAKMWRPRQRRRWRNSMHASSAPRVDDAEDEMNKFNHDLVQGMKEAADFVEGKKAGTRVHVVEVPDVYAIRQRLHVSQQ